MAIQVQQRYRYDRKAVIKQSGDFAEEIRFFPFPLGHFPQPSTSAAMIMERYSPRYSPSNCMMIFLFFISGPGLNVGHDP